MLIPMKRLTLVALKQDEDSIMQALQALSAVQLIETEDAAQDEPTLAEAENDVLRLNNALNLLKPYAKKPSFLVAKPEHTLEQARDDMRGAMSISEELEAADRKKAGIRSQMEKNSTLIEQLTPWQPLSTKLSDVHASKHTALFTGMLNAEEWPQLAELPETAATQRFEGEKQVAVLILCAAEDSAEVSNLLKGLNWTDVNLPNLPLTAVEAIEQAQRENASHETQVAQIVQQMSRLGEHRAQLASAADAAAIERDRAVAKNTVAKTADTFALEGWARSDEESRVRDAVAGVTEAFFLEFREPTEEEFPLQPSVVQNKPFVESYEAVTNLYSRPAPGSIDGTPLMTPWYFLLFGMMLGDTAYGLILAIGAFLFIKKAKPVGMMGALAHVIMWGGISTIVWGPLIGTCLGYDWNVLFGTTDVFPLLVDPNKDPMTMLILCFGLGIVHIFCGVGIKMYMSFKVGDWQTAIFDNFSWFLIIFGLIIFAVLPTAQTIGIVMAIMGALMVLVFKGRGKPKAVSRVVSGLAGLYDITSYLSDVLSYARLFALGIATGVIGSVFNQLVGMLMGASDFIVLKILLSIVGIALLVGLHMFNLGINTLGTFIHCARLQYVEFYGKFYEVGGKEFKPLGYKTKHTKVHPT